MNNLNVLEIHEFQNLKCNLNAVNKNAIFKFFIHERDPQKFISIFSCNTIIKMPFMIKSFIIKNKLQNIFYSYYL